MYILLSFRSYLSRCSSLLKLVSGFCPALNLCLSTVPPFYTFLCTLLLMRDISIQKEQHKIPVLTHIHKKLPTDPPPKKKKKTAHPGCSLAHSNVIMFPQFPEQIYINMCFYLHHVSRNNALSCTPNMADTRFFQNTSKSPLD
jgi:hypothetical protein